MSNEIEKLNDNSPNNTLPLYLSGGQRLTAADVDSLLEDLAQWQMEPTNQFIWDFALSQQLTMQDIAKISERFPRFSDAVEMLKLRQESLLWRMGMGSKSAQFIKWMLCTHHGYRESPDDGVSLQDLMKQTLQNVVKTVDYSKDK